MNKGAVLVVDDDATMIALLTSTLVDDDYEVISAVGAAALAVARDCQPDVILLDIMMPEMDGVEVSEHLRADPLTREIPIIAISAVGEQALAWTTMAVDERLPKPFDLERLAAVVGHWVTKRREKR